MLCAESVGSTMLSVVVTVLYTVSPRINVHALIFEDLLSFRKQGMHSYSNTKNILRETTRTYIGISNDLDKTIAAYKDLSFLFCPKYGI